MVEYQATLSDRIVETEVVLDEEEATEETVLDSDWEPYDLADRAYEEWRDEKRK